MTESPFANVPVESDTRILSRKEVRIGDWPVLHERWFWEGIRAETMIFLDQDVAHLDDDELKRIVQESPLVSVSTGMTVSRQRNGYTFVNFNFKD